MSATLPLEAGLPESCERERGKPLPGFNHFCAQSELQGALRAACAGRYLVGGELTPGNRAGRHP